MERHFNMLYYVISNMLSGYIDNKDRLNLEMLAATILQNSMAKIDAGHCALKPWFEKNSFV